MTAKPIAKIQTHAFYKRNREVKNKDTVKDTQKGRKEAKKEARKWGVGKREKGRKD